MSKKKAAPLQRTRKPKPGDHFEVSAPTTMPLDEVRKMIRDNFGFEGHIKVQIGPFRMTKGVLDVPVTPIDDTYIDGTFPIEIQLGWCQYFGILKPPSTQKIRVKKK